MSARVEYDRESVSVVFHDGRTNNSDGGGAVIMLL